MDTTLKISVENVLDFLQNIPLSDATVRYYRCCYNNILSFCEKKGINKFSTADAEEFYQFQDNRFQSGKVSKVYILIMRRAAFLLAEYCASGDISWERKNYNQPKLCPLFARVRHDFEQICANTLSQGSTVLLSQAVKRFLLFLETNGHQNFSLLSYSDIQYYILQEAPAHKGNMVNLTWPLKKFLAFLKERQYVEINADILLSNPIPSRKKVLPCFSSQEVDAIFSAVDRSTPLGLRDYAFMKLALSMGLRACDIVNLQFNDIDWHRSEINIVQQKTGNSLVLPLLPDVGNALAAYILNGRPKTDNSFVFIRMRKPYHNLKRHAIGANIMKRYMECADVQHSAGDGRTFHAFRRTAGTRLVEAEIPLPTVSQILGHRNLDSTKCYIALHDEGLRVCCMDLRNYATTKEGLA
ncbi:MAG: Integrase/recombinase [Candidatus Magnetoglobus multicellularis str. Araruama]|uniref:Integrase/recombinase n=1 Tax=Candidatus Magnetoglobus multicellularis str. Araruama TaxID=890399 RepID=A0A1V1PD75_9BACT|nr:MAG: Integrase/recombinase [Candidatus Magnetoglobus multicellularis str. Araruama]